MIDFLLFMLNVAWKTLGLVFGLMLFIYIMKHGSGTFRKILDTIGLMLQAAGHWIRKKILGYLRKEASEAESKVNEKMAEDTNRFVTYTEFEGWIRDHDNKFTID